MNFDLFCGKAAFDERRDQRLRVAELGFALDKMRH
jgi:hypothetical protein